MAKETYFQRKNPAMQFLCADMLLYELDQGTRDMTPYETWLLWARSRHMRHDTIWDMTLMSLVKAHETWLHMRHDAVLCARSRHMKHDSICHHDMTLDETWLSMSTGCERSGPIHSYQNFVCFLQRPCHVGGCGCALNHPRAKNIWRLFGIL